MSQPTRLSLAIALIVAQTPALAQNVPTRLLSKPDAEFPEPFSYLSGVRELNDGRLIVIDPREKALRVIDMTRGTSNNLGREGSGPGEYAIPFRLLALPGDTTAMSDMVNNRMLVIHPDATVGGFLDPTVPAPVGEVRFGSTGTMPTEADIKGRLYYQGLRYRRTEAGPRPADSVPMIRWDRTSGERDTVAWMPLPDINLIAARSGQRTTYFVPPFGGTNLMLAAPDGRVAIVHHDPYKVDFVSETGQRTIGQPIPYERLRISDGHKAEWREAQRGRTNVMSMSSVDGRSTQMEPGGQQGDPPEWGGEFMPPFLGPAALAFSNDGHLWIRRTGPPGQPPLFDVIDRAGNLVQKVVLPKRSRLVGFGKGVVYIVRVDDDDLQYLQKYRWDRPGR
jgi:hypothetical protein